MRRAAGEPRAPLLALGAALCALALLAHSHSYRFLNDDAFISFRYAFNWSRRGEVVYNLGERVEGYTNFLWVALLAAADALGASIPSAAHVLGALAGVGALLAGARLSLLVSPAGGAAPALLAGLLVALSPSFACWTSGGLEAPLFALLLTAGLERTLVGWGGHLGAARAGGLLLALAALTRPEGLMFGGVLGAFALSSSLRARLLPTPPQRSWALVALAVLLPYQLWRWRYYGYPLPNTYYVKEGSAAMWGPGGRYLLSWLLAEPWLLLSAAGACHAALRAQGAARLAARVSLAWLAAQSLHVAHVGGDFMALHRFMAPLTPLCAAWAAWGAARGAGWVAARGAAWVTARGAGRAPRLASRPLALALALALALVLGAPWALHLRAVHARANRVGSAGGVDSIGWLREFVVQCERAGRWVARHTPPNTRLATTAAGAISFYADRYTLDLLGLNDSWVAHNVPARGARPGHTKSAPFDYVLRQRPDLLIYHPTFGDPPPRPHPGFARALKPNGYEWRVVEPEGLSPRYWGLWARRGAELAPPTPPPAPPPPAPLTLPTAPQDTP